MCSHVDQLFILSVNTKRDLQRVSQRGLKKSGETSGLMKARWTLLGLGADVEPQQQAGAISVVLDIPS